MRTPFCKQEFHRLGPAELEVFGNEVGTGIYGNATVFDTPSIKDVPYQTLLTAYSTAYSNYKQLGITKKVAFLTAKEALLEALDSLAAYVDSVALGNISTIALSGFVPSSDVTQKTLPLEKIISFNVYRSNVMGQVIVDIPAILGRSTVNYGCIVSEGEPLINPTIVNGQIKFDNEDPHVFQDFNKGRHKIFNGLKQGVVYYFYVYAMNNVNVSPLSDSRNLMAA